MKKRTATLYAHGLPLVLVGLISAPVAVELKVPIEYYAATISVIGAVYIVVRTTLAAIGWMDKKIDAKLEARMAVVTTELKAMREVMERLPCGPDALHCPSNEQRNGEQPAHTPLPVAVNK